MSHNPSHVQGYRETKAARAAEMHDQANQVWAEIQRERHAIEERTAKLQAMRLVREGARGCGILKQRQ
ncbi:MAG: hypothetical protein EON55_04060 [Alphaproteobacteria bacterium]|nr:MAG: hypothetical protein EON55_04060 [Alphaproteobacteria bacterium]